MSIKHVSLMVCGLSLICGSGSLAATGESAPITVSAPDFIIPLGGKSGTLDIYFDGRPAETSGFNVLGHQRVLLRANSVSSGMVTLNLHLPGFLTESFEDPFAVRLLPDSPRFSAQARFFNLGVSAGGAGILTVYRTNGKSARVIHARSFESEEKFFYQRKMNQTLGAT